jgi:hypothetical protein
VRRLALSGAAWLSRAAVALVFMLGMLATAGATQVVVERDLVVERGEDTEGTSHAGFHVQSPRRIRAGAGALAHQIENPSAPRVLAPPRRAPAPQPTWQRPRRTAPPPEDDEERLR